MPNAFSPPPRGCPWRDCCWRPLRWMPSSTSVEVAGSSEACGSTLSSVAGCDGGSDGALRRLSQRGDGARSQEVVDGKSRRTQRYSVAPELSRSEGDDAEGHSQCLFGGDLTNRRQEPVPENLLDPPADDDSLGVEQVDEVGNTCTEIRCRLLQDPGRGLVLAGRLHNRGQARDEVGDGAGGSALPQLVVPSHERPAADVRLETSLGAAATGPTVNHHGGVPPLARAAGGPAVQLTLGKDTGAGARAQEHDNRAIGVPGRTKPLLSLSEGLGSVRDNQRQAGSTSQH